MKRLVMVGLLVCLIASWGLTRENAPPGYYNLYYIMDAQLASENELYLLCADGTFWTGNDFVARFERVDDEWRFQERVFEDLFWSHTINITPERNLLISDSLRNRALIITPDGQVIWNSQDFGLVIIYPNDAELNADGTKVLICVNTPIENEIEPRLIEVDLESGAITLEFIFPLGEEIHDPDYHDGDQIISVLMSLSKTYKEYTRDFEEVFSYGNENWVWPRNAEKISDGKILIADMHSISVITPDTERVVLSLDPDKSFLYNIHVTPEGLLCAEWSRVFMLDRQGNIKWQLRFPRSDQSQIPIPFDVLRNLAELGYVK